MNEIIRAKTLDGIQWITGRPLYFDKGRSCGIFFDYEFSTDGKSFKGKLTEINPETICHPIGLFDRYEQDIFTNDLFYHKDLNEVLMAVWEPTEGRFEFDAYRLCGDNSVEMYKTYSFADISGNSVDKKINAIPLTNLYDNRQNPILEALQNCERIYGVKNKEEMER